MIAGGLSTAAGLLGGIRPTWALLIAGAAVGINAFTERVQGGLSKTEG